MNLEELLDEMQNEMHSAHEDIEKFNSGNKSAGTRVRKSMQKSPGNSKNPEWTVRI